MMRCMLYYLLNILLDELDVFGILDLLDAWDLLDDAFSTMEYLK